ncbi:MAG: diguanylate cyclase [Acetobacterium sp.]
MHYKIAIIDDNSDDVFAIKRMLLKASLEYKINEFNNPIKALIDLSKNSVDCIILDFNFPVMNGLEFIKEFKKIMIDTPIILITGQGNEKIAVDALKNGACDYILKDELSAKLLNKSILKAIGKRDSKRSEKTHLEFIKTLVDITPVPLFYKDKNGIYLGCNKAFEAFIGKSKDEIIGKTAYEISMQKNADDYTDMDKVLFDNPGKQTYESEYVNSDNELRHVIFDKVTYNNSFDEVEGLIGIVRDITESKRRETELSEKSYIDSLTGIRNRRYFDENIEGVWERCREENESLSLIMIDIDLFKNYNDYYGHQLGDTCLKKIAQGIKTALLRLSDIVTRYGGEEFVVILPNTNTTGAIEVAERIKQNILNLGIKHEDSIVKKIVTVSQGIGEIKDKEHSVYDCLMHADQSLYQAKNHGRNRIEVCV